MKEERNEAKEKKWMREAYELGRKTADLDEEYIVVNKLVPNWVWYDHDAEMFFKAGREGYNFPEYRTGWRYGDIPETSRSYNHRENTGELGLSVMQLDGDEKIKTLSELNSLRNRPKVRVGGFVLPFEVGGDGEPLLICAERI